MIVDVHHLCPLCSDQAEVADGIQNAVLINRCGDMVRHLLERIEGIAHCHADASSLYQRGVVAAITESCSVVSKGQGV